MSIDGRQTVTIPQAMEMHSVCRRTVANWIKKGKVEFVKTPGGTVRIFLDTLVIRPPRKG